MFLCFRGKRFTPRAMASALMFLEATRTIVRGRQPRSGLMSLCSYVLMFSALAAARFCYSHLTERCKFRPFLPRLRSRR